MTAFPKPVRTAKAPRRPLRSRSPMKRGKQLRAKRWGIAWKRPRRLTPRDPAVIAAFEQLAKVGGNASFKTRPNADPAFVAWAHEQGCTFARYVPGHRCHGTRIVFCHEGEGSGMGLKAPDQKGFAGCEGGHREYTDLSGEFKGWKKADLRAFEERVGESEYARYLSAGSRRSR
jgi:hypothetical protein